MKVIGYTDVIQVFFLILGGLGNYIISSEFGCRKFGSSGVINGFNLMTTQANDHFHMIFEKNLIPNYMDLPGLSVLIGGMLIINLNCWGCNQYITQRALGADQKLLETEYYLLLFEITNTIIVVYLEYSFVLYQNGHFGAEMLQDGTVNPDRAYPVLLNLLPVGLKGLSFAALLLQLFAL
jgi:SSS family solute:Na+ symporter